MDNLGCSRAFDSEDRNINSFNQIRNEEVKQNPAQEEAKQDPPQNPDRLV